MTANELEKKLEQEGKTLAGSDRSAAKYPKISAATARKQAQQIGLKGLVAEVFEKEARKGLINESQFENVTQQGLMDELITPLTLGLVHGPGASTTSHTLNPTSGTVTTTNQAGVVEQSENTLTSALSSFINGYGIRALEVIGGTLLILFGLFTISKKQISLPSV